MDSLLCAPDFVCVVIFDAVAHVPLEGVELVEKRLVDESVLDDVQVVRSLGEQPRLNIFVQRPDVEWKLRDVVGLSFEL